MPIGDYPALMDPGQMGILSAAFAGLNASGPQRMPVSLGQVMGQAWQSGLQTYMGALESNRRNAQTQALIELERQKAIQADLATRVQFEDVNMRRSALGLPPIAAPSIGGQGMGQMPSPHISAPQMSSPQMQPQQGGGSDLLGAISKLPPELQQAARADIAFNGGKGLPAIIAKAGEPVIGREGGIYKRDANGNISLDPGWLEGERERRRLAAGIESDNTLVDVPMADGTTQRMTKADALKLAGRGGAKPSYQDAVDMARARLRRGEQVNIEYNPSTAPGFSTGISTKQKIENAATEAAATETAKKDADTVSTYRQKLPSMAGSIVSLNYLEQLNADDKTYASAGAEIKKDLGRIAQAFGIKVNEKETANTEQYIARIAELMKERLASKDYGSGTGVSNLDLIAAAQPLPEVAKTRQGRLQIIEAMKKDVMRSYGDIRGAVDYFEANKNLTGFKFPSEAILRNNSIPKEPAPNRPAAGNQFDTKPPAAQYRGKRIRDTSTGQMFESDGMSWKAVK